MTRSVTSTHTTPFRRLRRWAVILPCLYLFWCLTTCMIQERFIFPRSFAGPGATSPPRGVEPIWIDAGPCDKPFRVEAWFLPPSGSAASNEARSPAVLFFHGNAELIDNVVAHTRGWRDRGYAVLLCEYRGYGRSGGKPSQAGIVEDAQRFYDALIARPDIDPGRIILHGRSLGGGVACQLAATRPCLALILESAFTSVAGFAWSLGVPPFFVKHPFYNDRILATLDRPVLIMHGADDDIIPPSHGRSLHAIARRSTYRELPGGHNDFPRDENEYWAVIEEFLRTLPAPAPPAPDPR